MGNETLQTTVIDQNDDEHGIILPKTLPDPGTPSRHEILEHELTHLPFRAWCPYCMAARGNAAKHAYDKLKQPGAVPVVGVDYAILGKTDPTSYSGVPC